METLFAPALRRNLSALALFALASTTSAGSELSRASAASLEGALTVSRAPAALFEGASTMTVESIDGSKVVLSAVGNSGAVAIELAAETLGLVVGDTVEIVASSVGYSLLLAGEIIAFVPTELGMLLTHHRVRP
ncbi:MAG: hypothetical protein AAGE01_11005 [Pseudomonadota bacterium]